MGSKRKIVYSELTYQDVICPICLSILIEPVTMPCTHSLCMPCFNQHVSETSLACPLCRKRISIWVRRNMKAKRLINTRLWQTIKEKFSSKVEARLQGVDESDEDDYVIPEPRVCAPGELRQEYEALVEREEREMASRRSQEEELSNKLILQMQEEEKMKLRHRKELEDHLCKEDEVLAQQMKEAETVVLQEQMKQLELLCGSDEEIARQIEKEERMKSKVSSKVSATPLKGPMDIYIGQKTPKSLGKLLVPDVRSQLSSRSSDLPSSSPNFSGKPLSTAPTTSAGRLTPTSSINGYIRSFNNEKKSSLYDTGQSRSNLCSGIGSSDSKFGRQLREITSSQSSESETEEFIIGPHLKRLQSINSSGKENVSGSKSFSPRKFRNKGENSPSYTRKSKSETLEVTFVEESQAPLILDSDETDIDDESDYISPKKRGKKCKDMSAHSNKRKLFNTTSASSFASAKEQEERHRDEFPELQEIGINCSMDYGMLFTNDELYMDSIEKLREEQLKLEEQLKQEEADRLFAQQLQSQLNQELRKVNRSRGSADEYALRNRRPVASTSKASPGSGKSPSVKRERQTTLTESVAKRRKES